VEVVRAAMAVRANQIGAGGAGVGNQLLDALIDALRAGVTPFVRELGSLGTGDLTALAEIGIALGGEGWMWVGDDVLPAAEALERHGLTPVHYGPRDGIGFLSSNAVSIGQAALVYHDARRLLESALGVAALSFDATSADFAVLDPRVHAARPHHGQVAVARRLRQMLGDSQRRRADGGPVHDAFVFRCVPQVEGMMYDALERLAGVLDIELNVAGENALMIPADGEALPNGNFHAGVLTVALDSLRGAMAHAAARPGSRPGLGRDDPGVHGPRRGRRGALAGGHRRLPDDDRAVRHRVARQLREPLGAAHQRRAGTDGRSRLGGTGAGGESAAPRGPAPDGTGNSRALRRGGGHAQRGHGGQADVIGPGGGQAAAI
jgi:hypothetical protein